MRIRRLQLISLALLVAACETASEPLIGSPDEVSPTKLESLAVGQPLIVQIPPGETVTHITPPTNGTVRAAERAGYHYVVIQCLGPGGGEVLIWLIGLSGTRVLPVSVECLHKIRLRVGESANVSLYFRLQGWSWYPLMVEELFDFPGDFWQEVALAGDVGVQCLGVGEERISARLYSMDSLDVWLECVP